MPLGRPGCGSNITTEGRGGIVSECSLLPFRQIPKASGEPDLGNPKLSGDTPVNITDGTRPESLRKILSYENPFTMDWLEIPFKKEKVGRIKSKRTSWADYKSDEVLFCVTAGLSSCSWSDYARGPLRMQALLLIRTKIF